MAYICQPIGSVLSGVVLEQLGRKRGMMIVNIPHIIAWIMMYYAKDLQTLFMADLLLGLGIGFMEAPVLVCKIVYFVFIEKFHNYFTFRRMCLK